MGRRGAGRAPARARPHEWHIEFCNPARIEMTRLLGFTGMTVGGWIGWWIGSHVGLFTAFLVSMVGTGAGLYAGRRIGRDYLGGM
jgi:hypothetical protein